MALTETDSGYLYVSVPEGYLFEIEYLNALASVPAGEYVYMQIEGSIKDGVQHANLWPNMTEVMRPNLFGLVHYGVSQKVKLYGSNGFLTVFGHRETDSDDLCGINFTLSGQLVPLSE